MVKTNKGFTFIEILLYISIVVFLFAGLMQFALSALSNSAKNNTEQEVYEAARYVSERLKYEIRNAVDINIGSSNFDSNLAQNLGQKISLKENAPNDPLIIDVLNGKVRVAFGAGAPVAISSTDTTVSNLTFTNYSSANGRTKHIGFVLTVTDNYTSVRQEYSESVTLESSAELRNN